MVITMNGMNNLGCRCCHVGVFSTMDNKPKCNQTLDEPMLSMAASLHMPAATPPMSLAVQGRSLHYKFWIMAQDSGSARFHEDHPKTANRRALSVFANCDEWSRTRYADLSNLNGIVRW